MNELEDRSVGIIQTEQQRKKRLGVGGRGDEQKQGPVGRTRRFNILWQQIPRRVCCIKKI